MKQKTKPWGGRFTSATDHLVEKFTESVSFDQRLYRHDIQASIAHAQMLHKVGVISKQDKAAIIAGLQAIQSDVEAGTFIWDESLEDVHMNIEVRLTEQIGEAGKRLHTGRSRNDQVATDIRLYSRDTIDEVLATIKACQLALIDLAEQEVDTILPGLTHLQVAQPISFGHHLLAWVEMLLRDAGRFKDARVRINVMPLGSAALAGTSFPIDRDYTAELLGFDAVSENSLDAVSDRDFLIEFNAAAALLMVHLSRMAEEIILWASDQYQFIEIGDAFCTGSSIMPQKKNPDVAELIRGKTGRVNGNLVTLLMLMKAQPLAYNRDNQEDKQPLFDSADTVLASLRVFTKMIPAITVNRVAMHEAALSGYATATDLAEYLVGKGVAFRDAHEVVGKAVRHAIDQSCRLDAIDLNTLAGFCDLIDNDVYDVLSLEGSIQSRDHYGGTAPAQVRQALARARQRVCL